MIEIKGLSAGYQGKDVIFDLSFAAKENICILGENGCGKTTLLRALAGLIQTKGSVAVMGEPLQNMKRREVAAKIALLSQFSQTGFAYSVEETVMLGRYRCIKDRGFFGAMTQLDREAVNRALAAADLLHLRKSSIAKLSGGQMQRVFLARTLAQEPAVILLDEPTNHLDMKHQMDLISYLKDWSKPGERMVIGAMHDINLAMRLADRGLLMKDGRFLADGSWRELLMPDLLMQAYGMDVMGMMLESLQRWEEYYETNLSEQI